MTRAVDFRLIRDDWQTAAFEMERLAASLPDGTQRWEAFNARMLSVANTEDYLVRRAAIRNGLTIILMEPGPLTRCFLDELRAAVAARQGIA